MACSAALYSASLHRWLRGAEIDQPNWGIEPSPGLYIYIYIRVYTLADSRLNLPTFLWIIFQLGHCTRVHAYSTYRYVYIVHYTPLYVYVMHIHIEDSKFVLTDRTVSYSLGALIVEEYVLISVIKRPELKTHRAPSSFSFSRKINAPMFPLAQKKKKNCNQRLVRRTIGSSYE